MKKIIHTCLFLALIICPSKFVMADESSSPPSPSDASGLQANVETAPVAADGDKKTSAEEIKAEVSTEQKVAGSDKPAPPEEKPKQQESAGSKQEARTRDFPNYRRPYSQSIKEHARTSNEIPTVPADVGAPVPMHSRGDFMGHVREITREVTQPKRPGFTSDIRTPAQPPASHVVVVEKPSDVRASTIVTVQRPDERYYRERELRERELRRRDWELKERENRITNREFRISEQERAFRDRDWYNHQLRIREWEDIQAANQELRYLLWRERELSQYYWRDKGRVCRYVTSYKTGVRINKRATICERRNGVYKCFHPKRYFIYPVTKIVCYRPNDRRLIGIIIRPYPY